MSTATRATTCPVPGCEEAKAPREYLCWGCWFTLRRAARIALDKRDDLAKDRLSDLLNALAQGTALHQIEISR